MIGPDDLKEAQAEELKARALRDLADFRRREHLFTDIERDRAVVDTFFHMMALPASLWLAALTEMHAKSRAHVANVRRDCERRYGREP